jgi:hypothetical protein
MTLLRTTLTLAALSLAISQTSAQKIKWDTGEGLPFLKDQKQLAVDYDYSKITIKGGDEQAFLKAQQEELNKDEAGKGDEYVREWTEARAAKYQVHFENQFNKDLKGEGVTIKPGTDAKYTVMVVANDMEVGKGKTFVSKPAKIDFTLFVVETANKSNVVAKGKLEDVEGEVNAPKGSGWIPGGAGTAMAVTANVQNRSYSNRLAESYEKAAAILAKYIKKNVL